MLICPHSYLSVDHAVFWNILVPFRRDIIKRKEKFFIQHQSTVLKPGTWTRYMLQMLVEWLVFDYSLSVPYLDTKNVHIKVYIYIYIYIYTRFQKGFHIERYIDRYILLFSCTCARAHFSLLIVQLVKKLVSTINSLLVRFFVPICQYKRECTNIVCNSLDLHSFEN